MRRGRGIERADVEREEPVAVVNQALVDMVFGREDPIGKRIRLGNPAQARGTPDWLTIVGVVANTPTFGLAETSPFPQMFTPTFATRQMNLAPRLDTMSFVVRATDQPEAFIGEVRSAVRRVDANLAIAQLQMLEDVLDRASAQMAFTMILLMIAAIVALMLGVIGVYGVMSYVVTQRTGEIGVRLTLGAKPGSVAAAIVNQGGRVAAVGVAVGLGIALVAGHVIQSLLYGVSPRDPGVFGRHDDAFDSRGVVCVLGAGPSCCAVESGRRVARRVVLLLPAWRVPRLAAFQDRLDVFRKVAVKERFPFLAPALLRSRCTRKRAPNGLRGMKNCRSTRQHGRVAQSETRGRGSPSL